MANYIITESKSIYALNHVLMLIELVWQKALVFIFIPCKKTLIKDAVAVKYAIWNNKGGVGKTFLTFMLSTEYAYRCPQKKVVLIDMCPQANLTEIILGGNSRGSAILDDIVKEHKNGGRLTIGGYFDQRLSKPDDNKIGSESSYCIRVKDYNENLPENLYLVCGDPSLELQVQSINQSASVDLPENRWRNVHLWVKHLQDGISAQLVDNEQDNITFFIDCNPSFATYTAQALIASGSLIVPCTADGSSARAFDNISQLLYGVDVPDNYKASNFSKKAKDAKLELPKISLIPLNRTTIYGREKDKSQTASAFLAMYNNIKAKAHKLKDYIKKEEPFLEVPDAHTVAIVCSYHSIALRDLQEKPYQINDKTTLVNKAPLDKYKDALERIMTRLL